MPRDPLEEAVSSLKVDDRIQRHADRTGLDPELIRRVVGQESGGKSNAKSWAGAGGLMQLMPGTAARFNVKNVNDPEENMRGGTDYLRKLTDEFGDPHKVLAAYNAGEGAVRKHGYEKVRSFSNFPKGDPRRGGYEGSTGAYVDKILKGYQGAGFQDPLSDAVKTLKGGTQPPQPTADPLDQAVTQLKPANTPQQPTSQLQGWGRGTIGQGVKAAPAQAERQRPRTRPITSIADLKRADEQTVDLMYNPEKQGVETNFPRTQVDPRVLKGEQPSDPMAYAKAQELIGRVEPKRTESPLSPLPPSMRSVGPRTRGIGERVDETLRDYVPGYANLDTPMGIKTDLPRGILNAATMGAVPSREISREEKLINPQAEGDKAIAEGVGQIAGALIPFTLAGKIVAPLNAPRAVKTAVQFGLVDAGHQVVNALKGQDVDWSSPIIQAGLGVVIGKLEGQNPRIIRRVVAFVAPQLALDVAKGTPQDQAVMNAVTNLGFALSAGGKERTRGEISAKPETTVRADEPQTVGEGGLPPAPDISARPASIGENIRPDTSVPSQAKAVRPSAELEAGQKASPVESLATRTPDQLAQTPEMVSLRPVNKTQAKVEFTRHAGQVSDADIQALFPDNHVGIRRIKPFAEGKNVQQLELTFWNKEGTRQVPVPEDLAQRFGLKSAFGREEEPQIAAPQGSPKTESLPSQPAIAEPQSVPPPEAVVAAASTPETKPSKLAQGVEAKAVAAKLTEGFSDLPEYKTVNVKDQAQRATELLDANPEQARKIALGDAVPEGDLLPESVFTAVENRALASGDTQTLLDLARGSRSVEASTMGQRIRMLGERNPHSPVKAIADIERVRSASVPKERVTKTANKIKTEIEVELKKTAPKVDAWQKFLSEIVCK